MDSSPEKSVMTRGEEEGGATPSRHRTARRGGLARSPRASRRRRGQRQRCFSPSPPPPSLTELAAASKDDSVFFPERQINRAPEEATSERGPAETKEEDRRRNQTSKENFCHK